MVGLRLVCHDPPLEAGDRPPFVFNPKVEEILVFNHIDDDEWLELSLELSAVMSALPPGSRIIEALAVPTFRAAIKASGAEFPNVITVPFAGRQPTARLSVAHATSMAELAKAESPAGATIVSVTQTDDGQTISIVVAGLPGERCSFSSFELRPGSHNIDVGFEALRMLQGWAIRSKPNSRGATSSAA